MINEPLGRVAVFWHYDCLPPHCFGGSPGEFSLATLHTVSNLRQALYQFGIITSFSAYATSMPQQTKWELQSHGVTVIDCIWTMAETMITADMFRFALDNPSLGTRLVLISCSPTFAYTVAVLEARRYRVTVVSAPSPNGGFLVAQASEVMDWPSLTRGNANHPRPAPSPPAPAMQNSSDRSSPEHPTGIEPNPHAGSMDFLHNLAEALEHSFTVSDLNVAGNGGERSASPLAHPSSARLEVYQPLPVDGSPPSRQIEEAILNRPVVEDVGEQPGPRSFDSKGQSIDLLTRPFNRSVSELALGVGTGAARPRANSLQDERRLSPAGDLTLEDHILMRSLPVPTVPPSSVGGVASGKPLNVEAPTFIPSPRSNTPPNVPGEEPATTIFPPAPDPSPVEEPVRESRSPSPRPERRDSTCSATSTSSTVRPAVVPVTTRPRPGPPTKQTFSKAERRAVETVINVLLEMKSKGEARVNPRSLPPLILAKDRMVYKGVGNRGNRFWRLIDLGVRMGWLEAGPANAWIDVGKGWTE
ncbi:hypothetical protein BJ322DRAFT_1218480 [Thelephora terrestris]|uniref:NYN domain-containing protein n=1 Tax=Thelephora terrestris TaxID=56493 RepID=A0A9P6HFJ7_9AGAM|nr:hypothetical protein BJ322DRAFT_1218480 [Thelephora terrestris]